MQRLSGHYQCACVRVFMAVQNYCLLNRFKIQWPRWSITAKGRVDTNRPSWTTTITSSLPRGGKKRHNGPDCPEQNDHVSQRPRRDYQDDKETPDSGSPKLDAEITIGGATEVKPLKR